jgi:hypothetical protein
MVASCRTIGVLSKPSTAAKRPWCRGAAKNRQPLLVDTNGPPRAYFVRFNRLPSGESTGASTDRNGAKYQ